MELYITDLAAYNEGQLVGRWVKLPLSEEKLSEAIAEVLSDGEFECQTDNHEEVFITDYESDISIGEYDDIYRLNKLAKILEELDERDLIKLKCLSHEGYNEKDVLDNGLETYEVDIYDYRDDTSFTDTFELLAQDFVDEGLFGEIPKSIQNYIDYSAIARDLRMDYTEFETNIIGRVA